MTGVPDRAKIHQGPGNIWFGCQVPSPGSRLVLDVNGNPTATGVIAEPGAPALSSVTGGTLAAATYYVEITLVSATGETEPSAEVSLAVIAENELVVQSPAPAPGALGWNIYVATTAGAEKLQNTAAIPIGSNWTQTTTPVSTTAAPPAINSTTALYGGAILGAITVGFKPKIDEIFADQVTAPIDARFTSEEDFIEITMLETDLAKLENLLSNGLYSTGTDTNQPVGFQSYEQITFGGLFVVPQFSVAVISPRVACPGKYVVSQLYQAYPDAQVSLAFSKEKPTEARVTFKGLAMPNRPLGDQVGQIWRQL